jgi:hypothetical protein
MQHHDALGGKKGYFYLFCGDAKKPELLCEDLGKVYYADIVIKPWSSCRVTHPYIDATMQIVNANNPDPTKIAKVIAHTTPKTAAGFCCTPWEVTEDFQPTFGPGTNYCKVNETKPSGLMRDVIVPGGTEISVFFEAEGWVYAEFTDSSLGLITGWFPKDKVQ